MKRFFKIEKAGVVGSWSGKLIGTVLLLTWEGDYFVEVQVGSSLLSINKKYGSIITEKEVTPDQKLVLDTITRND